MKKTKEKSLQKEVKTIAPSTQKRKLTQEDINYLTQLLHFKIELSNEKNMLIA